MRLGTWKSPFCLAPPLLDLHNVAPFGNRNNNRYGGPTMPNITRRRFVTRARAAGIMLASAGFDRLSRSGAAHAQTADWPNRPVRFIVPLAPGGAIDFIARA